MQASPFPDSRTHRPETAGRLIVVVDDDREFRNAACELLEEHGYACVGMPGGETALQYLRNSARGASLILLDLKMPGVSGWDFRKQQLEDDRLRSIPVVVMTVARDLAGIKADEVVRKPVDARTLLEIVKRHAR